MDPETYYRDHWADIDDDRLDTYEETFAWHPRMAPLLEGAGLEPGQRVLDFGCGPGGLALELARRVGAQGRVHGLDLNASMIERARNRAGRENPPCPVVFEQLTEERLPFPDDSFDRVICKSVLEYVTSPGHTMAEFARVTCPGGRVHIIDSDWDMLVVEPIPAADQADLFAAASMAYRTPRIGRQLYGLMRDAGLEDPAVKVLCAADTTGIRAFVVRHMIAYARESGQMDEARLDGIEDALAKALEQNRYLMILPQFVVTGRVAG